MELDFCVEALKCALRRGRPEIFNSDQGSQFTSEKFTGELAEREIAISMDGRGRCMDNIFIERLWRSLKYEEVYLKDYASVAEARAGIERYFRFYNRATAAPESRLPDAGGVGWHEVESDDRTRIRKRSIVEVGDAVPEPLGFIAFRPEWLVLYWRHLNGG